MSGYQRFVSYVYEYHKGKKGGNCGFVKVEIKEQTCRIEVHLSCMGLTPCAECKVYGIQRNGETMEGIFLGSCMTAENRAEGTIEAEAFNLDGRGISFSHLGGLVLKTENGAFFGTEWDDQPICPEKFREAGTVLETLEEEKEREASKEETETVCEEQKTEKMEETEQEQKERERPDQEERETEVTQADQMEASEQEKQEELEQARIDPESTEQTLESREDAVESEVKHDLEKDRKPVLEETARTECQPDQESWPEILHTQEMAERISEKEEKPRQSVLEPEFDPFGDGELTKAWKIQPRDFRNLNRQDWGLRNNRFLMYGYYNFGHLLLGKRANGSYILGVPGRYDQQERFMANMFGFPFFRESKEIQLPKGKGGYWYRLIHTPNFHDRKEGS